MPHAVPSATPSPAPSADEQEPVRIVRDPPTQAVSEESDEARLAAISSLRWCHIPGAGRGHVPALWQ